MVEGIPTQHFGNGAIERKSTKSRTQIGLTSPYEFQPLQKYPKANKYIQQATQLWSRVPAPFQSVNQPTNSERGIKSRNIVATTA